jgi:hypothetical protein
MTDTEHPRHESKEQVDKQVLFMKVRSCNTDITTGNMLPLDRFTTICHLVPYQPITKSLTDQARCIVQTHTFSGGCIQGESETLTRISDASSHTKEDKKFIQMNFRENVMFDVLTSVL